MAVQYLTFAKIVGPSCDDVARRFASWSAQRISGDNSSWDSADWPVQVRLQIDRWITSLAEHATQSPVVYWSKHVDLWATMGELSYVKDRSVVVQGNSATLFYYQLPDRGVLRRKALKGQLHGQFPEDRWIATRLVEAIDAYTNLGKRAALIVIRESFTSSPTDEEMAAALKTKPQWLRAK